LDAEVSEYLFDFPYENVTVRSLLNHTSGLGNYMYITDSLWNQPDSFMSNDDMYELVRCEQLPIYHPPLKRFDYCNTNYALVPILIERVTNLRFETFMQQEIFDPLGMDSTRFLLPADAQTVEGHYPNGDEKRAFYLDGILGDKSLYSSTPDLLKLYAELKQPKLWRPQILKEAMCADVPSGHGQFYGLGWRINPNGGDTIVFHNGWWRGFRSYFWMSASEDKVAIILTNSIRGGYMPQKRLWSMF
jgi:CubicO group peptidase (beta-lactamase class C family)